MPTDPDLHTKNCLTFEMMLDTFNDMLDSDNELSNCLGQIILNVLHLELKEVRLGHEVYITQYGEKTKKGIIRTLMREMQREIQRKVRVS